jgi:hypothetical protein
MRVKLAQAWKAALGREVQLRMRRQNEARHVGPQKARRGLATGGGGGVEFEPFVRKVEFWQRNRPGDGEVGEGQGSQTDLGGGGEQLGRCL